MHYLLFLLLLAVGQRFPLYQSILFLIEHFLLNVFMRG
jgi:hypothetical protein